MAVYEKYLTEIKDAAGTVTDVRYNIPQDFNFGYDCVDTIAKNTPDKRALFWCNDHGAEKTITFGDMKKESDKYASYLLSRGIKKGDKVMLILKRHFEYWHIIVALHKIGAITIPATNQLQTKDIVYRLDAADIKAVVCTPDGNISDLLLEASGKAKRTPMLYTVRTKKDGFLLLEEEAATAAPFEKPADLPTKDDIMLLYFTSGTTGMPKMVMHNYAYPIPHIATAKYWHKVVPDGLHLTIAETGWAKAAWGKIYGQWMMEAGIYVYDMERFVPQTVLENISKHGVTTLCAPPTMYRYFIKENLASYDLSKITHATIAGEALNPEVYEQFKDATSLKLMEGFGQTETTLQVVNTYWMEPKPGSMGRPMLGYDMEILDEDGQPVPVGVNGEICIKLRETQPELFAGYYMDDERTKNVIKNGCYHTGDIAWRDEDGYYWYVGRNDDIIKSSGYRIGPFEVESVLMEHAAVMECAVTGVPDPVRGQIVKATIVLAPNFKASDDLLKEIQNHVKTNTAPYKYPRVIEFVEALPKTISGKIRRVEIRGDEKK